MIIEIIIFLSTLFFSIYLYLSRNYAYWKKKGVDFVQPKFPFGTMQDQFLGQKDIGSMMQQLYTCYKKKGLRYFGTFTMSQPTLILIDLNLCKQILSKDFHYFTDRNLSPKTHEYISKHLFALDGQEWKDMRTKLTPTFTSGKMKNMFGLLEKCAQQLQDHIEQVVLEEGEFEVKDLTARFTTDVIATCAFGIEVNSIKNREDEFYKMGQTIFKPRRSLIAKIFLLRQFPFIVKLFKIGFFDQKVTDMLTTIVMETEEYRKKNNVVRNDFLDLLYKVKEHKDLDNHEVKTSQDEKGETLIQNGENHYQDPSKREGLTLEEMTAQTFIFFAAGFETAASTTSFCLYELSKDLEVQDRLRKEIDEVLSRHGGEITYQSLQEMTYMDQVMNETLRLYASLPFLTRVCTETYRVPDSDLVIDRGVRVSIPSYAIHHDPDIYPDPYRFDPERFSEQNCKNRHQCAFTPFGEGPRNCIGMRFGKLQVKTCLAAMLSKYQLSPSPNTPKTIEISPFIVLTTPKNPFKLRISRRSDL